MADSNDKGLFRQESLERLSSPERLDELMTLVNFKAWLPLGTIGIVLVLGLIWSVVGRIPVTTNGQGTLVRNGESTSDASAEAPGEDSGELVALLHFDNRYRGQLYPGMPIVLIPETLLVYNQPGVNGEIIEVLEPPPLTLDQARQQQEDPQPATSQEGRLEVVAKLPTMDPSTPDTAIVSGVGVVGRITIEERAPIAFILPFLDR